MPFLNYCWCDDCEGRHEILPTYRVVSNKLRVFLKPVSSILSRDMCDSITTDFAYVLSKKKKVLFAVPPYQMEAVLFRIRF